MPALNRAIDVLFHCTAGRQAEGGLKCFHNPALTLAEMDSAGIAGAFVSQCKQWSCERQWMCVDTRLDDVLHYTQASPRFFGLAGYNPFDIAESMREIELAFSSHGFRGIFAHAASFGLPLTGALMYPLYAKAVELGVPVLAQLGVDVPHLQDLCRLMSDFPELVLVLAPRRPDPQEMSAIAAQCENVYFALDSAALAYLAALPQAADFFAGPVFRDRCMWGSNGVLAPPLSLPALQREGGDFLLCKLNFLHDNAARIFALERPLPARTPQSAIREIVAAER